MLKRLADAVGYDYIFDGTRQDYVHAASLVFVSAQGKIARYLGGTKFNPADLKLAVIDASEGRSRSFMQKIERLCFTYVPEVRAYVVNVNRIVLAVTLAFAAVFALLLVRKGRRPERAAASVGDLAP